MSISELRNVYVRELSKSLNVRSKFYQEDLNGIKAAANRKNQAELIEAIKRWGAINSVSQAEINIHCQFGGLPKIGD